MRMRLLACIFLVLIFASCNNKKEDKSRNTPVSAIPAPSNSAGKLTGEELYNKNCLACHQSNGSGVPGMYPPLTGTEMVLGPDEELIRIVLYGIKGPLTVKGKQYNQVMPAQDHLSDQQIADILNYIRSSWGNSGPEIGQSDVQKIRQQGDPKN